MMKPLRWGLAGTGSIAATMATALSGIDDADLVAVGSRNQTRAEEFAARHGIGTAYGSYEGLAADGSVDIVYIATPHSRHCEDAVRYLSAGKHVLCEKAMALNAGEVRTMIAAARDAGRFLAEAMWTWHLPAIIEMKRRIESGAIGTIRQIDADFSLKIEEPTGRHRALDLGGGSLLDLGIYPLALARLILGAPTEVKAIGVLGDTGVDTNLGVVVGHSNGGLCTFQSGLEAYGSLGARITGTLGTIRVEPPFWYPDRFTIESQGETEQITLPHLGLAHEVMEAMARIRGGHLESSVVPLAESLGLMETMDEIRRQIGVVYPADRPGLR